MNGLLKAGGAAGAMMAIVAAATWGGGFLAWSGDIKRLDRQQAETAVETYSNKIRGLIVITPPAGSPSHEAWKEELNRARDQLKRAEDRKIELSK